mmetsp:Transcript_24363/g.57925  ORF Transcript_24363/g.57925 Transcript_24363/m.57925 type:complete len:233 (+) Transcript_24363:2949-3647(+)
MQARHPAADVLRRRPLRLVRRSCLNALVLPVYVFLSEVESSTEIRVLLVVPHDAVREHPPVPVGDHDPPLNAGHGPHLLNDRVPDLLRHDHDGVVRADHQGCFVLFVIAHLRPPLVELHSVGDMELEPVGHIVGPAVADEVVIDVDADSVRASPVEETDDLTGAAPDLDHDIVRMGAARVDDAAAGVLVEVVKHRVLIPDGVLPRVDGQVLPQLGLVVVVLGFYGCIWRHCG